MTVRSSLFVLSALCTAVAPMQAGAACQAPTPGGGPSWMEVRHHLEQRVLETPTSAQARLVLAQYLTYCDTTRREGILQLAQLAKERSVSALAVDSWRQALAWVESDASSIPLYRAYLRLRPNDRQIREQLAALEGGGLLPGNRGGAPVRPEPAMAYSAPASGALHERHPVGDGPDRVIGMQDGAVAPTRPAPAVTGLSATSVARAQTDASESAASAWAAVARQGTVVALPHTATASQHALQTQIEDLRADIRDIEQKRAPEFALGSLFTTRQGEDGMSRLTAIEVPMQLTFSMGEGKLGLRLTPVVVDAGEPATLYDVLSRFGAGPVAALPKPLMPVSGQSDAGLGIGAVYEVGGWRGDVGTTPLGFGQTDVSAGLRYRQVLGQDFVLDLAASRRPLRDSVLSFSGSRDPRTRTRWGGVSATGGRIGLTWDIGPTGIYGYGALHRLTGTHVASNIKSEAGAGIYQHFFQAQDHRLTAGFALTALKYQKNLRYFTFGHGGYFSPQGFFSLALPLEWQQRVGSFRYHIKGSVGVQYMREKDAAFFPTSAARQAAAAQAAAEAVALGSTEINSLAVYRGQSKTGLGYGLSAAMEYQLQPQLRLGGYLGFDNARDYRQFNGGIYLRYAFEPFTRPLRLALTPVLSPYEED